MPLLPCECVQPGNMPLAEILANIYCADLAIYNGGGGGGTGNVTAAGTLTANQLVIGQGGTAISVTTTSAGALTFLGTPSSANLRSLVTDESGTGALLFAGGNGGAFTVTTINGLTITTTATGTLTIASGGTLITSGAFGLTLTSTATTNATFPAGTNNIGYLEVPSNSQSAAYPIVLSDSGKSIDHPATDANARTYTIPANGSIPFPVGTCISFSNMTSQVVTIAITTDTMYLAGVGTTGSRSLAQYGVATARKITATAWLISGTGLT